MDRHKDRKISRRDFVGRAGLGAATLAGAGAMGVDLEARQTAASAIPATWEIGRASCRERVCQYV